jgi:hypothetical protein
LCCVRDTACLCCVRDTACLCCVRAQNPARKGEGAPSAGPAPAYTEVQQAEFDGRAWIGECRDVCVFGGGGG